MMRRILILAVFLALIFTGVSEARQGCCSHHGGVCGCRCCDGSPLSAKCSPYYPSCSAKTDNNLRLLNTYTENKKEKLRLIDDIGVLEHEFYLVERVVDGDTLLLSNGERVRLIGVDTPETVHPNKPVEYFGKESSNFTKKMVQGMKVRLEYDQTTRDKYGRLLAYVFLEDNTFLNAEIIKQGYGHAYTTYPFKLMDEFRQYEREARENQQGLWKQ